MNYVIINGVNSNTIPGLLIQSLPPISKPLMRTEVVEIDGRDGDIVYDLGYSAYDKQLSIGLHGNFDIDQVIKFFTGKGTVIFSNEPDKYYNFQIINQIDYQRLLRYRTATVTMHVQPYKYGLSEFQTGTMLELYYPGGSTSNGITSEQEGQAIHVYGTAEYTIERYMPLVAYTINNESLLYWIDGNTDGGEFLIGIRQSTGVDVDYIPLAPAVKTDYTVMDISAYSGRKISYLGLKILKGQSIDMRVYLSCFTPSASPTMTITNDGNADSVPTYILIGTKTYTMSIDGTAVATFDFGNGATVYVNTQDLNAKKADGTYFNRNVTGNYADMRLSIGEHEITLTSSDQGASMICIVGYPSRWI